MECLCPDRHGRKVSMSRLSCLHGQTFVRSSQDFCAFTRRLVHSYPDFCDLTRRSCVLRNFRAFVSRFLSDHQTFRTFMSRISCVHQTFCVFVSSRSSCVHLSLNISTLCLGPEPGCIFISTDQNELAPSLVKKSNLENNVKSPSPFFKFRLNWVQEYSGLTTGTCFNYTLKAYSKGDPGVSLETEIGFQIATPFQHSLYDSNPGGGATAGSFLIHPNPSNTGNVSRT